MATSTAVCDPRYPPTAPRSDPRCGKTAGQQARPYLSEGEVLLRQLRTQTLNMHIIAFKWREEVYGSSSRRKRLTQGSRDKEFARRSRVAGRAKGQDV